MMEMDDRDSAKCQKSKKGDISGIIGKFNEEKDKTEIVVFFFKRPKMGKKRAEEK